ncbi:sigma-70 family RNA polymerase sigma factor [Halobacillus locisalis]|uniref:Sigma-70 family RNA polymerase sigma factor n=1 Tax=Halobacillus locisalis TaxID=220753 RepID=A0A838CVR0_9BACI|nr:sigma-70 family RNA polymerase sigma factor [Halobacillus locisalis]MBA2176050.1 sigma-70 family RNA polymerase sigma factor [Halobacillus locisalis]
MEESMEEFLDIQDKDKAIQEIMDTYGQSVLQLVYAYVKNKAVAEDLTQEIFVKCYKNLHKYNGKSKLKTWLWSIAINHSKDYLRSWYNRNVVVSERKVMRVEDGDAGPEEEVIQNDVDKELVNAIMKLPTKYREVIYLYYYEELNTREMAKVLRINENTIKTRLKRAKVMLKEQLGGSL